VIPKEWEGSNFYHLLGISPSANFSQIKAAYRKLAQELHPDRNQGDSSTTKFNELNQAYKVLSKEKSRSIYDDYLFGASEIPIKNAGPVHSHFFRYRDVLVRVIVVFSLIILIAKLGVFSPKQVSMSSDTAIKNPDVISGKEGTLAKNGKSGLNGKDGASGKDGLPGNDGSNGLNGKDGAPGKDGLPGNDGSNGLNGKDGIPGKDGSIGPAGLQGLQGLAGQNVTITSITTSDKSKCSGLGGALLTGSNGSFEVCNGATSSESSGSFGSGQSQLNSCDSSVNLSLKTYFDGDYFKMKSIELSNLSGSCNNNELVVVLKIVKSSESLATAYANGDSIKCTKTLTGLNTGVDANVVSISDATATCASTKLSKTFTLSDIYALDVSGQAAGLLIQIAS
jgi:curved DNA-binding protein CbpA